MGFYPWPCRDDIDNFLSCNKDGVLEQAQLVLDVFNWFYLTREKDSFYEIVSRFRTYTERDRAKLIIEKSKDFLIQGLISRYKIFKRHVDWFEFINTTNKMYNSQKTQYDEYDISNILESVLK